MRKNIFLCIICAFLAGILLFIGLVIPKMSKTKVVIAPTEIEATVVETIKQEEGYLIETEEYACKLFLDLNSIINQQALTSVVAGEKIYFKLIDLEENLLQNPKIDQIVVATFRTETEEIITEESFYGGEEKSLQTIKSVCIFGAVLLGGIAIIKFMRMMGKSRIRGK